MKNRYSILLLVLLLTAVSGCIRKEVNGIKIGHNLIDTYYIWHNYTLCSLIENTLQGDSQSLKELIMLEDGGAAGGYDKGDVIVQIISKLGEKEFIIMAATLDRENRIALNEYIEVGIEYGQQTYPHNHSFEKDFPQLHKLLRK